MRIQFLVSSLLLSGAAFGAGFYLPNQDALATAKGNAWMATADNAAAVYYNPAGLTQLERPEVRGGLYAIVLDNEAEIGGQSYQMKRTAQGVPSLFYAQPYDDNWSFGLGVFSPFGLGGDWGNNTPFRNVIKEAQLIDLATAAAAAYQINDEWSIGANVAVHAVSLEFERGIFPGPGNDYIRINGDGYWPSASFGVHWKPAERHAFGLTYSTSMGGTLEGKLRSNVLPSRSAEVDVTVPQRAAIGYSYRPAPGWNLEANIEWLDWDHLNSLDMRSSALPGGFSATPMNWKSCLIYEIGASYRTPSGWVYAVGYDFNGNAQPDSTFNPVVSDDDRSWFNAGFGHEGETWAWFVTGQFGISDRTVDGATGEFAGANGSYAGRHVSVMTTLRRAF